jgi:hypothetical protein
MQTIEANVIAQRGSCRRSAASAAGGATVLFSMLAMSTMG